MDERRDFEQRLRSWNPETHPARLAQRAHEVAVRNGIRRGEIDDAVDLIVVDQPAHGTHEVLLVNPRHHLPSVADVSAEAETREAAEDVEGSAAMAAHHDRAAHLHLARAGRAHLVE